jgi:magnesium transporter
MLYQYRRNGDRLVSCSGTAAQLTQPIWIDLLNPTREEEQLVERMLSVSLPTRGEMQEIEVSARLYQENGAEFMTVTVVNELDSDEPSLTPLTFVLKDQTLVTIRYTDPQIFTTFVGRAQKTNEVACSTGEQVMLGLLEALSDRMADALERVAAEVDQISREVFRKRPSSGAAAKSRDLEGMIEQIGRNGDLLT